MAETKVGEIVLVETACSAEGLQFMLGELLDRGCTVVACVPKHFDSAMSFIGMGPTVTSYRIFYTDPPSGR